MKTKVLNTMVLLILLSRSLLSTSKLKSFGPKYNNNKLTATYGHFIKYIFEKRKKFFEKKNSLGMWLDQESFSTLGN